MKYYLNHVILLFMLFQVCLLAKEKKAVTKEFSVSANQKIEIETMGGMEVDIVAWDQNIVKFDLLVSISASSRKYEKEFVRDFNITSNSTNSLLEIEFEYPDDDGWSFWNIFKLDFDSYVERSIKGTIYIPKNNSIASDFKYCDINLRDIKGEFILDGRGNTIHLENCSAIKEISNPYGEITLNNCSGDLNLNTRGTTVKIFSFTGNTNIIAHYSKIELKEIDGKVNLESRSSDAINITDVSDDVKISSDYSKMYLYNINGFVEISNRSGSISIIGAKGVDISSLYTQCTIKDIKSTGELYSNKLLLRSGSLKASNVRGHFNIDDNYSNFEFDNIEGNINLISRSGTIAAKNIIGNWHSSTQYSKITLDEISAKTIEIENRSDPVSISSSIVPDTVLITNQYGQVNLTIPDGYQGEIELSSQHGSIECELPIRIESSGSTITAVGKIENGNGRIHIENRSADIILEKK